MNLFVSMAERASTAMKVVIKLNFCYYMSRLDADSGVIMSKVTATTPLKRQEHHAIFCHAIQTQLATAAGKNAIVSTRAYNPFTNRTHWSTGILCMPTSYIMHIETWRKEIIPVSSRTISSSSCISTFVVASMRSDERLIRR